MKTAQKFINREIAEEELDDLMNPIHEDRQLPSYAGICDRWILYYVYKQEILKNEYGIEWLSYLDLNEPS